MQEPTVTTVEGKHQFKRFINYQYDRKRSDPRRIAGRIGFVAPTDAEFTRMATEFSRCQTFRICQKALR